MGLRERFEQMTEAWNVHEFDGLVTVFSELHGQWLDADSPERAELAALGVDRLILYVGPPFDLALRGVTVR